MKSSTLSSDAIQEPQAYHESFFSRDRFRSWMSNFFSFIMLMIGCAGLCVMFVTAAAVVGAFDVILKEAIISTNGVDWELVPPILSKKQRLQLQRS